MDAIDGEFLRGFGGETDEELAAAAGVEEEDDDDDDPGLLLLFRPACMAVAAAMAASVAIRSLSLCSRSSLASMSSCS